jgi:hypothetical protein
MHARRIARDNGMAPAAFDAILFATPAGIESRQATAYTQQTMGMHLLAELETALKGQMMQHSVVDLFG